MLDWATISPALVSLFSGLAFEAQTPAFSAKWAGRSQTLTHPGVKTDLILQVRSVQDIGEDETRWTTVDIAGTPTEVLAQWGMRRIILQVRVESQQNTDTTWAWSTVERIRTRLRRPGNLQILNALDMALIATGPAVQVPTPRDLRMWSVASMDVTFGAAFLDPEDSAPDWIQSVEITSKLKDEANDLVPYTDLIETPDP